MIHSPVHLLAAYPQHCALVRPADSTHREVQLFYAAYSDPSALSSIQSQLLDAQHIGVILSNGVPYLLHRGLKHAPHKLTKDWQQLYPHSTVENIRYQKLLSWDTLLSYHVTLPQTVKALIPPHAQLHHYHHWTGILKDLAYRSASDGIYIGLYDSFAFVLILHHNTLSYANQFDLSNEHLPDALIYYLKACQQVLTLPVDTLTLWLYGEIEDAPNTLNPLRRYFSEVQLLKHPDTSYPQYHRFYDLFAAQYTIGLSYAHH